MFFEQLTILVISLAIFFFHFLFFLGILVQKVYHNILMSFKLYNEKEHETKTITCITKFVSQRCAIRIGSLIFCSTYNVTSEILVEEVWIRPNEQKYSEAPTKIGKRVMTWYIRCNISCLFNSLAFPPLSSFYS